MTYTKRAPYAQHGFTMIELMIAIVVLGLLFTGGIVSYNWWRERAAKTATREILNANSLALRAYYEDIGKYPEKLRALYKRPAAPEEAKDWGGPYVKSDKAFKDGWKKKLIYNTPGDRQSFELSSHNKQLRVSSE